jgi:hypothetical protein
VFPSNPSVSPAKNAIAAQITSAWTRAYAALPNLASAHEQGLADFESANLVRRLPAAERFGRSESGQLLPFTALSKTREIGVRSILSCQPDVIETL